jgi:5-hydroxyisourate hydrolase-like protein (transthyretin family)
VIALGATLVAPSMASGAIPRDAALARVPLASTKVQLQVADKHVTHGQQVRLSGRLVLSTNGDPVAGEDLRLQYQRQGLTGWRNGTTKTTGSAGRVDWKVPINGSTRFRVVHPRSAGYEHSASDVRHVALKPAIGIQLKRQWVRPSGAVTLKGRVRPAFAGERVALQRRSDAGWRTVQRKQQGHHGRVSFRVGGTDRYGPSSYRLGIEKRDSHLAASSKAVGLTTVRLVTYRVETRGKIVVDMSSFRQRAAQVYADPRGWTRAYVHFKRVKKGGAFSLVLSQAKFVPSFGSPCSRYWSCRVGRYVIINQNRWRWGTPYFKKAGGSLREYRAMVVNHETGHWFGLGHATCGGAGQPAPVMMQQSKGLHGCKPNSWPLGWEIAKVR